MTLMAVGVGIGVALLLLALTAVPALQGRQARTAWHATTGHTVGPRSPDGLLWMVNNDHYRGDSLLRITVSPLGPDAPIPPGLDRDPAPGEVMVSPALGRLLVTVPTDQLAVRLPGRVVGTIGDAGLVAPDELVAVVGADPVELRASGAAEVHSIETRARSVLVTGVLRTMLVIAALGLLVPVVVFIAMVTRIAAARREQRFAAIRLIGATGRQIAVMAAVETGVAAALGAILGWLGYLGLRPVAAGVVTFDGLHFVARDVVAPGAQVAIVLVAVPVLAMITSVGSLHRVRVTPLGVTRGVSRPPLGRWRLLVPVVGLIGFAGLAVLRTVGAIGPNSPVTQLLAAGSLLSLLLGLVVAGPWTCVVASRWLARVAIRAPALIAARRIGTDPAATFRAIAGVVIAIFVTGMFAGVTPDPSVKVLEPAELRAGVVEVYTAGQRPADVDQLSRRLVSLAGVQRILTVHAGSGRQSVAVSCADLATMVNIACGVGQPSFAGLPPHGLVGVTVLEPATTSGPVHALYVVTGDGPAGEDRIRGLVAANLPTVQTSTRTDQVALDTRQLRELNRGLQLGTVFVLLVAACSLTVGAVASLTERRRPFTLLRAAGMQLSELRRVVVLETTVPLLFAVVISAALGVVAGGAIATASGQPWSAPAIGFPIVVGLGLVGALLVTATTLPLINAVTHPNTVRFD